MHIHAFLTCASCRCRRPGKLMSLLKMTAPRAVCVCFHTYALKITAHTHHSPDPSHEDLDFVHDISSPSSLHNPHQHTYPNLTQPKLKLKKKQKELSPYQPSISPSNSPHSPLPQHLWNCRMYSTAMSLVLLSLWLLLLFLCWCCWCADHVHHC